ncbi:MAG: hypothetical protein QOG20_5074 [Pseudonocardiales bacterium]|jgi:hypothetical protein|nr:hypothetical protein [Pseudonocardiales bacterium]
MHAWSTCCSGSIYEIPLVVGDFLDRAEHVYPDRVAVVTAERRGREVLYRQTVLASALLRPDQC